MVCIFTATAAVAALFFTEYSMLGLFTAVTITAVVAGLLLLVVLVRSDGDLLLMFKTKFGKQPESLAGKVVWITGASSGIGEHISYCLAAAGCKLVLSARRKEELDRVKQRCLLSGKGKLSEDDVLVLPLDVVAFESHKLAVQQVLETFNKIDILVNNAGRAQQADWMDVDLSVDREIFEINVFGPVSLTQEVLPHMIQRKQGQVVVISSIAGKIGAPRSRSYTGSKHALQGYFESLRTEIGEHNIDVTVVCPGPVESNISAVSLKGKPGEVVGVSTKFANMMATDRCAYLTSVAIANKLYETWISTNPALAFVYVAQYLPDLMKWISKRFAKQIIEKLRKDE